MSFRLAVACIAFLLSGASLAQEQAFTNRATPLKDRASADAATVASLPENAPVRVVSRAGAWTRVESEGKTGFVSAFHLRFPAAVQTGASSSNPLTSLGSALGLGRREQRTTTATTGIRGLSPEDLKNASPAPEQLRQMQSYRADNAGAQRFAREGKLNEASIDYEGGSR